VQDLGGAERLFDVSDRYIRHGRCWRFVVSGRSRGDPSCPRGTTPPLFGSGIMGVG
jgi:hypothetical protein